MNNKDWLNMSDSQRQKIIKEWDPYKGEGLDIIKFVEQQFTNKYNNIPEILDINVGVYHGGVHIVGVTMQKGSKIDMPKEFLGFKVIKFWK